MELRWRVALGLWLAGGILLSYCFAQERSVHTIVIDVAKDKFEARPSPLRLEVTPDSKEGTRETFRWVRGQPSAPFRIEFANPNPCEANISSDTNRVECVIVLRKPGNYRFKYQIVPSDQQHHIIPGWGSIFARVNSCKGCP